jgi:hypothetical protein
MADTISKAELLNLVQTERADLETGLGGLTEEQMVQSGVEGEWSIKDILAHLAFWERRMLYLIETAARGEHPQSLGDEGEDGDARIDRVNQENFVANQDRSLSEVLADYQHTFQLVLELLGTLSDEDLSESGRISQMLGGSVTELIAGDTYEHYQEHGKTIRVWFERQEQT